MKKRLYSIDLLRFIAALIVVLYHYTFRGYAADRLSKLEYPFLGKLFQNGYLGVDLFFIISGFVILMSAEHVDFKGFIKSRFIRLYPAFWVCVSLTFFVTLIMNDKMFKVTFYQYLVNLTMLNGFTGINNIDGVYWSLKIELQFYFIIGILSYFNKIKTKILDLFILGWLILTITTLFIDFKSIFLLNVVRAFFVLDFSSYFISGMLFYKIYRNGFSFYNVFLILISAILSIIIAIKRTALLELHFHTNFSIILTILIVSVFYIIVFLISIKKLNFLNQSFYNFFGVLTYPIYLIHQNIAYMIFNRFGSEENKYQILIITILSIILVSYVINKFVEVPFAKWLKIRLSKI